MFKWLTRNKKAELPNEKVDALYADLVARQEAEKNAEAERVENNKIAQAEKAQNQAKKQALALETDKIHLRMMERHLSSIDERTSVARRAEVMANVEARRSRLSVNCDPVLSVVQERLKELGA